VVNMALDDALTFKQASFEVPIAVNVSAPLFADARLPARIARALADRGLTGTALSLEITEDLLFGNMERSRDVLDQLRRNGIRIAIDDFGSGYSTLSYLCELHVDEVKLDRLLVAPVLDDARVATVVRTIIGLARELGLTTVAEGIENAEVARRLADFGCDVGQGFFFSAPVPADEALRLLHDTRRIPDHSAGV
ncbi:MAG: EAL domain-containing protein, partial [Mycobacterium sp.]|nr:EAL domain-containing protein [Mycobacterium sp.]